MCKSAYKKSCASLHTNELSWIPHVSCGCWYSRELLEIVKETTTYWLQLITLQSWACVIPDQESVFFGQSVVVYEGKSNKTFCRWVFVLWWLHFLSALLKEICNISHIKKQEPLLITHKVMDRFNQTLLHLLSTLLKERPFTGKISYRNFLWPTTPVCIPQLDIGPSCFNTFWGALSVIRMPVQN